ncbi:Helix-turn-helix [Acidaminococcus fermentans]|uniref:helix-turn-helix transcriptional regulator n=1 Tax=Acidaminococcus fermentans TaxID=905 RepID=UPI0008E3110F|nr:helix-turn-helix transcriptional regulator [Acidaminococcus fermentans]SFO62765.1 Helix-turn-helix [Acidaminococcus fermentans]
MDPEDWKNFRDNMRYHRLKQGISIAAMGRIVGHSPGWVSATETGAYIRWPNTEELLAVSKALGLTLRQMIQPVPKGTVLYVTPYEADRGLENLEAIRKHKGLSKSSFAVLIDVTDSQYSNVSNGYNGFGIKTWWKIADALGMDLNILIGRKGNGL